MIGYLTTNNAYDTFVIMADDECRAAHRIDGADAFRDALLVGDEQDLTNWSGDLEPAEKRPTDFGEVIAINDGETLQIVDGKLFVHRRAFWLGE